MTSGKQSKRLRHAAANHTPNLPSTTQQPTPVTAVAERQDEFPFVRSEIFHGPLPPPETLAQYKLIDPTFAERIVIMAEREQRHRHEYETRPQTGEARAQWMLFGLGVMALIAAVPISIYSNAAAGAGMGLGAILTPVAAKIWMAREKKQSDDDAKGRAKEKPAP